EALAEEIALNGEVVGDGEADSEVALAPPDVRHVDREDQRGAACGDSLVDRCFRLRTRSPNVHLEPARTVVRKLGGRAPCGRSETHDRSGGGRGTGGRLVPVRMRHSL